MLPHTIRGRLLLWFAVLLGLILGGFGFTATQLHRISGEQRIDDELQRRVTALQVDWRSSVPPGGGAGGRGGKGGKGGKRPGPPDRKGRDSHDEGRPLPDDGPPPENIQLRLSADSAAMFQGAGTGYYYVGWTNRGRVLAQSGNAPADVPFPREEVTGRTYSRTRGIFREMYHVTVQGDCVLAGISTADLVAARRRLAWWLTGAGAGVLLIGLSGGWIIVRRSLRPVHEISAAATRIANGALAERVKVEDDRNELGALAAVLNSTFARLEAAISDEKSFTSDASHELRTPLTVLLTETQRSRARERTAAEYRQTIDVCHDTAQEMKRLVESLLELARLDAGQDSITHTRFDLATAATQAAQSLRPLAQERGLTITFELQPAPALGDADRIRRVAVNLIQNAIRYNRPDGTIHVTTSADETHAILTVSDTGVGIGPEDLPHIFKRFHRADKARSRSEGNSGLGLAICKSIVDAHHGSIDVRSSPGDGTTFTVRIPRR